MAPRPKPIKPPVALLTHNPSPGLYSRLERAVEQLPETVKIEGLENRLKKFGEGVAGWELDPVMAAVRESAGPITSPDEFSGTVPARKDISKKELLDIVRRVSPAFTHKHVVLTPGGRNQRPGTQAGRLGEPTVGGDAEWRGVGGGDVDNYREHLLLQDQIPHRMRNQGNGAPYNREEWGGGHFEQWPQAIAHMRTGDVGDAVRLIELQSDIRNKNLKHLARGGKANLWPPSRIPLYDHYPDVFLKALLLDAARTGKGAIEIPALDSMKAGFDPGSAQQLYGQLVPNKLLRIARPLGGLVDAPTFARDPGASQRRAVLEKHFQVQRQREAVAEAFDRLGLGDQSLMNDTGWAFSALALANRDKSGDTTMWSSGGFPDARPVSIDDVEQVAAKIHGDVTNLRLLADVNKRLRSDGRSPIPMWVLYDKLAQREGIETISYDALQQMRNSAAAKAQQIYGPLAQGSDIRSRIARELEAAREAVRTRRALEEELSLMPVPPAEIEAPSRRLQISDATRRRIVQGGIGLSVLAGLSSGDKQAEAGVMDFFRKAASGQPMSRREFLRGAGEAAAAAAASRIPAPTAAKSLPSAPVENLSAGEWIEMPTGSTGFRFLGDGYVNYYPHNHMRVDRYGDAYARYLRGGEPPMHVEPPTVFDEVSQKEADDFLRSIRDVNYSVPGMDTDPATGLVHSQFRYNKNTGKWHPYYIKEERPNVFRDVYLEPGAPRPVELPPGIIDPVQRAYEENPSWMLEEWPEWTTGGKQMLLDQRQRWLESMAEEWRRQAESDPEAHRKSMETDPEYRKSYEQAMEQVSRARGARHNIGPQPPQPDVGQLVGNFGLPGDEPTERTGRIRRLLQMGVPLTAAVAAGTASAAEANYGFVPADGGATSPIMDELLDTPPPESPSSARSVPMDFTPEQHRAAIASNAERQRFAGVRAEEAAKATADYELQNVARLAKREADLARAGADPEVAKFMAAREYELDRPTISAAYYRQAFDPSYASDAPISPRRLIKDISLALAIDAAADGKSVDPRQYEEQATQQMLKGRRGFYGKDTTPADQIEAEVLEAINQHAPGGQFSDRSGISEQEFEALQKQHGSLANFMYPARLQPNFDALRQYELLATNTPADQWNTPAAGGLRMLGQLAAPFYNAFQGDQAPYPDSNALAELLDASIGGVSSPLRGAPYYNRSTIRQANRWYEGADPSKPMTHYYSGDTRVEVPQGYRFYRNPESGDAMYWRHSAATPMGLAGAMTESTDRAYARASARTLPFTQDLLAASTGEKLALGQIRADNMRPVPILRAGLTPEKNDEIAKSASDWRDASDNYLGAKYAQYRGSHPTGFGSMLLNLGRDAGDPGTLVDLAASTVTGGIAGAARRGTQSMVRGAAKGAAKAAGRNMIEETTEGVAQSLPLQHAMGGSIGDFLLEPQSDNPLTADEQGKQVDATNPIITGLNIDRKYNKSLEEMRKNVDLYRRSVR